MNKNFRHLSMMSQSIILALTLVSCQGQQVQAPVDAKSAAHGSQSAQRRAQGLDAGTSKTSVAGTTLSAGVEVTVEDEVVGFTLICLTAEGCPVDENNFLLRGKMMVTVRNSVALYLVSAAENSDLSLVSTPCIPMGTVAGGGNSTLRPPFGPCQPFTPVRPTPNNDGDGQGNSGGQCDANGSGDESSGDSTEDSGKDKNTGDPDISKDCAPNAICNPAAGDDNNAPDDSNDPMPQPPTWFDDDPMPAALPEEQVPWVCDSALPGGDGTAQGCDPAW